MNKRENTKKIGFLQSLPETSLESENNNHVLRCKFNFSYFCDSQDDAQSFSDWSHEKLTHLLDKLKHYSKEPLTYWLHQRVGGGSRKILAIYGSFPTKSAFVYPKHIPIEAEWARFRLEGDMRLIGFLVPQRLAHTAHTKTGAIFDCNTFYVVFFDDSHKFYLED